MWSYSDTELNDTSRHQEQYNTPCIHSPFEVSAPPGGLKLLPIQRKRSFNHGIGKKTKNMTKKSLQHWLRLQEIHHRIRDCEDETEKAELYISKHLYNLISLLFLTFSKMRENNMLHWFIRNSDKQKNYRCRKSRISAPSENNKERKKG